MTVYIFGHGNSNKLEPRADNPLLAKDLFKLILQDLDPNFEPSWSKFWSCFRYLLKSFPKQDWIDVAGYLVSIPFALICPALSVVDGRSFADASLGTCAVGLWLWLGHAYRAAWISIKHLFNLCENRIKVAVNFITYERRTEYDVILMHPIHFDCMETECSRIQQRNF